VCDDLRAFMDHLYNAEIYRHGAIFAADSTGLSSSIFKHQALEDVMLTVLALY